MWKGIENEQPNEETLDDFSYGIRELDQFKHRKYMKGESKECGIELKRNNHRREHIKMFYFC